MCVEELAASGNEAILNVYAGMRALDSMVTSLEQESKKA